jgi:hypothetical protein
MMPRSELLVEEAPNHAGWQAEAKLASRGRQRPGSESASYSKAQRQATLPCGGMRSDNNMHFSNLTQHDAKKQHKT